MDEEEKFVYNLVAQSKNIGYYAGLTYGIGYILMYIGVILVIIELLAYLASIGLPGIWSLMPSWFYASLTLSIISALFAIGFGLAVIKSAKIATVWGPRLRNLSSPISILSYMLIIRGIAMVILVAGINSMSTVKLSLVGPICGIVGPVLLLVGFMTYRTYGASESKIIATILMIISLVLIYFISIEQLRTLFGTFFPLSIPLSGPLGCEFRLEFIALLIALVSAMLGALKMQQSVTNIILSISGIIFSAGLMYYSFSYASTISGSISTLSGFAGYGVPTKEFYSPWIVLIGVIILGIAGIIALVASIMPLALAAKQFSTEVSLPKPEVPAPPAPAEEAAAPPPEGVEVKYCPKCGAKMPKDAAYCPKCGQKQPKT